MKWPEVLIDTKNGKKNAIAPLVISASRVTDIPAFYSKWFMNRLRAGYCIWENSFNNLQRQYITFENCRVFIFWSKNPAPIMPYLPEISSRGYEFYFQYTINDYEGTGLEPNLLSLEDRLKIFYNLSRLVGNKRIIWRFDPIILGEDITVENILLRFNRLAKIISPFTEKLVFSFVDLYKKTEFNLNKLNKNYRSPNQEEIQEIVKGIVEINNSLSKPLKLATCAENLDLNQLGIEHNKCVDLELLYRLCPDCEEFKLWKNIDKIKDNGQRSMCGCAPSKDIGSYNTCQHFCAYCYANKSSKDVFNKISSISVENEKL